MWKVEIKIFLKSVKAEITFLHNKEQEGKHIDIYSKHCLNFKEKNNITCTSLTPKVGTKTQNLNPQAEERKKKVIGSEEMRSAFTK
jgi:hypothetical protein